MAKRKTGMRRANGEGTIGRHQKGYWWSRIRMPDGRRKAFYGRTRQEVAEKLDEAKLALRNGTGLPDTRLTLSGFSAEWLESVRPGLALKTYVSYESLLRLHIHPYLGRKRLSAIQPADVQAAYSGLLAQGTSPATIGNAHRALHACLGRAVRWGLVSRNPCDYIDLPKVPRVEKPMFTEVQVQEFLRAAQGHRLEALFALALATGARSGELLALRWSDIDFEVGLIRIRGSLKQTATGYELGETKTAGSRRDVEIGPSTVARLRSHRARQAAEILKLGPAWDSGWSLVFANNVGRPLHQANVLNRVFRPLLEKAGLPRTVRFHDLRHVFASLALSRGMDVVRVSAMLGHSHPGTTLRIYSHAIPGNGRSIAESLDQVVAI